MWQDTANQYGVASTSQANVPLQFYAAESYQSQFYPSSRSSLEGAVNAGGVTPSYGGSIQQPGGWWTAFGTGGFEGEPPLLEGAKQLGWLSSPCSSSDVAELGINFSHIQAKSMTVLNPLQHVDERIMDDADLAGPLLFFFCFGMLLLLSGKPQFGYIYGFGLLGSISIYTLLNLMSDKGIDVYRVVSVLGYCLLPMVGVGAVSVVVTLDGVLGYMLSILSIIWCTYAASGIFVAVLRMSDQRLLVAYPVALLYGCFALLSVFNVGAGRAGVGR
ncbi:Yip1-domain-containing protein [Pisolithus albus]|nr:Yip1-domain-containing protein [Pisolithus albus]